MALAEYVRAARASRTAEDRLQLMIKAAAVLKKPGEALACEEAIRQQAVHVIECWCAQAEAMAVYLREREIARKGGVR